MKYTVTMVLTADSISAFSTFTLGKKLDGGAEVQSFGIGDYINVTDKIRDAFDIHQWDDAVIATAVREAICEHDRSVTEQLNKGNKP